MCGVRLMLLALLAVTPAVAEQQVTILPAASITYRSDPRMPGVSVAIIAGNPAKGPYTIRVRFAAHVSIPPHSHPDERTVTVLSGTYLFATGNHFDAARLTPCGAGTVIVVPAGVAHFVASGDGEVVLQESGIGPTANRIVGVQ